MRCILGGTIIIKSISLHMGVISLYLGVRMLGFDGGGTDGRALFF